MKYKREVNVNYLLRKVKRGYNLLSLVKEFSPSAIHNVLAGVLGVGVGITALYVSWRNVSVDYLSIPWVSDKRNSSVIVTVAGLQNLGNNCFLNVILQALSGSSYFLPSLQNILDTDDPLIMVEDEKMPLTIALVSLLEELCIIKSERTVLNPRRVMLAMSLYVDNFNLTRQQDAAEAFLHLLSSLEEEVSQCYMLHGGSLTDITAFPSKIYKPKSEGQNDCERWQNQFFGPFNGTIGNKLICTSCSSMLSMDFEYFRCLPLSPVLDVSGADIMNGLTVVDCLKHFSSVEFVENYQCSRCWHNAALKYLSQETEKDEVKIETVRHCVNFASCNCKKFFLQEEITWTGLSCVLKQLKIARSPKILCIHLQRAFMNHQGELIKLQGHISFSLHLDLFPFMEVATTVGWGTSENNIQREGLWRQQQSEVSHLIPLRMQGEIQMLSHLQKIVGESLSLEAACRSKLESSICESMGHPSDEAEGCNREKIQVQLSNTGSSRSQSYMYRLVSVVEHYGRPGTGHYAVYRRTASESGAGRQPAIASHRWFYISDWEVSSVSEETVLAAEASLLFYEKIE